VIEKKLLELQSLMHGEGILINFSGRFSQGIIEELGEAVKNHMQADNRPKNDIYNVFAIFIEQTQNIKNYCASKESCSCYGKILNSGIVSIGKNEQGYFICSGNLVDNNDILALTQQLDKVKSLDKDGLKKLYKEQMKKGISIDDRGAGLGLIDMARKASTPPQYSVTPLDVQFSFFTLKVMV